MRLDFYQAIKDYKERAERLGTFQKLDKESQRYVNKTLDKFVKNGVNLSGEKREKLVSLDKEISDLETTAEANIAGDKSKIKMSEAELKNLPKETLDKLA